MAAGGYVKLWRKSLEGGWLKDPHLWTFWTWCLMKATYKPVKILVGLQEVHLDPGQFVFGRKAAAEELEMNEYVIYRRLKFLESAGNLIVNPHNKFSIITIVNWETYQEEESEGAQQEHSKRTTSAQQAHTNKNIKNIKKEKKGSTGFRPCSEEEMGKLLAEHSPRVIQDYRDKIRLHMESTGKKYKSEYATILNWIRMDKDRNKPAGGGIQAWLEMEKEKEAQSAIS